MAGYFDESQTRYETCKEQSICLEEEYRYSSTLSLTSTLDVGEWSTPCPGRFTPTKESRYPHSIGAWVCPRAQNPVPHWKYTCNHKYLFCDAPTRVGPSKPSSRMVSRRNTFIINAVQDVYMYSQHTLSFKI